MNFDWLGNLGQSLGNFFQPGQSAQSTTLSQLGPSPSYLSGLTNTPKPPQLNIPQQQPQQAPPQQPTLQQGIQQGIQAFSPTSPLATMSGQLAQAGQQIQQQAPNVNPYLPAIIAMMESGGGMKQPLNSNNAYGLTNGMGGMASYPDATTALLGGGPNNQQGFMGTLMNSGNYNPFLQSGDMSQFFKGYTPPVPGNPTPQQLLLRYNQLASLFPQLLGMRQQ